VVAPAEAQALREKLDRQVAEWKVAGEAKAEELAAEMRAEIAEWARAEAERQVGRCLGMAGVLVMGVALLGGRGWKLEVRRQRSEG